MLIFWGAILSIDGLRGWVTTSRHGSPCLSTGSNGEGPSPPRAEGQASSNYAWTSVLVTGFILARMASSWSSFWSAAQRSVNRRTLSERTPSGRNTKRANGRNDATHEEL